MNIQIKSTAIGHDFWGPLKRNGPDGSAFGGFVVGNTDEGELGYFCHAMSALEGYSSILVVCIVL